MKKTIFLTFLLVAVQAVAFGQADSCFTLLIQPTLLGAPYYDIFPITVTNQTQGTTFTMEDSLLHNCELTGVTEHDVTAFSLSSCHPNPCEGRANVTLTTDRDREVALQLYDAQGRLKAASNVVLERGAHTVEVSLSGRGLHILRATSHGQSVYAKIVNLASSGGSDAVRVSAASGIMQDIPAMKTQQNVTKGDKIKILNTMWLSHVLDSVRSGLFVASLRETKYWRLFENNPDTLFWNENSLKYRLVAIPLPYDNAFLDDYNPNHLIWRYIDFQDSTFYVYPNPSCPVTDMSMMVNYFPFENGFIKFYSELYDLVRVWPLSPGFYKYRITQYPSDNDLFCPECQGQLEVYSQDGTFLMSRILLLRRANFPNVFFMQKGPWDLDDWFDEAPPYTEFFIIR